jgi:lysine/ornithine N-monooxygenase
LRVLALRTVCNQTPPVVSDCQKLVSRVLLHNYFEYLRHIKHERQQSLEHVKRLKARGIKPEDIWKHPYRSKARKKKEQEWETYCKSCVLLGEDINYSQR